MGRFEQRYSEEQVEAAREKIAAGLLSLRAAAAEIGCAPSTLSVRLKRAEAADGGVRERVSLSEQELLAAGRPEYLMALKRIALDEDVKATARDRLGALKELLKLEPAASEKHAFGSTWYVYPDRIEPGEEPDAPGGTDRS